MFLYAERVLSAISKFLFHLIREGDGRVEEEGRGGRVRKREGMGKRTEERKWEWTKNSPKMQYTRIYGDTHKTTLLKTTHLATTIAVRVLIMSAVHKPCTVCSCGALNMQDQKMQELKTGDRTPKNAANLLQLDTASRHERRLLLPV